MNFIEGIIYMIWRGVAIGVIISAPMGPVGILCVQRTLEKGRRTGFFTGVGAAISDLFYCLLTGFGLSLIEDFLKANQNIIQIVGSVVLILFGIYLFRSNPARTLKKPEAALTSRSKDVLQGFLFTVSNPLIIFLIIGLFARFNFLLPEINWIQYIIGYVSIIGGALIWWWVVTFFVDKVRSHFNLRSMWLINRITGGIIMLFALVGIFTAISSMASAANTRVKFLNSGRGFGELSTEQAAGEPLKISNETADTVSRYLVIDDSGKFNMAFRAANLHNKKGKSWKYVAADGSTAKADYPGWGVSMTGAGRELLITFKTTDSGFDEIYSPTVTVTAMLDGEKIGERVVSDGLSFFDDWNSYRIGCDGASILLMGGDKSYGKLLELENPGFAPDSIGFAVMPGGCISLDYISLETAGNPVSDLNEAMYHFGDRDVRDTYFARSTDKPEGVWKVFDRTLDDSKLRMGGEYCLAIVKSNGCYRMIYISGADKNRTDWTPGDIKGLMTPTGFKNVFDVQWLDPSSTLLEGEIKAQFSEPDLLTLQFVDHESQLRLRKIKEK